MAEKTRKIIDAHGHLVQYIAGTGAGGELRFVGNGMSEYASGERFRILPEQFNNGVVTAEGMLKLMDNNGVDKMVLLQGNYIGFQNLYSLEAVKKYPDRFRSAASYDPFCRNREQIRRHLFEELGFPIVKFEMSTGSGLMCNHFTLPLDDPMMMEEFGYAAEHDLICVVDIGKCGSESWQIEALRNVILRYPQMKFVVCHLLAVAAGYEEKLREGLQALALPNVWFDLAAVPNNCRPDPYPFPYATRYLRIAIKSVGIDKIMFGSDVPSVLTKESYEHLIGWISRSEELTENEKGKILYENAEEVYFA